MSTVKSNIKIGQAKKERRFAELAKRGEIVFHVDDLARLWKIKDKNTLHTTLKRYNKQGLIYRIWRGMYAIKEIDQIDPLLLGVKALHGFGYVSLETILFQAGIINQKPSAITLIGEKTRHFGIGENEYRCHLLSDKHLYNPFGIEEKNGIKRASSERAVADLLYFNSHAHFDAPSQINWQKVRKVQKAIGYSLIR